LVTKAQTRNFYLNDCEQLHYSHSHYNCFNLVRDVEVSEKTTTFTIRIRLRKESMFIWNEQEITRCNKTQKNIHF